MNQEPPPVEKTALKKLTRNIGISIFIYFVSFYLLNLTSLTNYPPVFIFIAAIFIILLIYTNSANLKNASPALAGTNHLISILQAIAIISVVIFTFTNGIIENMTYYFGEQKIYVVGQIHHRYNSSIDSVHVTISFNDQVMEIYTDESGQVDTFFIINNSKYENFISSITLDKEGYKTKTLSRPCSQKSINISHFLEASNE